MENNRFSGVLMPVSSIASPYGIGCFSEEAYDFVLWLKAAGQTYWQILPLGPTGFGDSPYQSFSVFAGNPYFIDLEELIEERLLSEEECENADLGGKSDIDYEKQYKNRYPLLRKAYERSKLEENEDYKTFLEENAYWLDDYALFMACKEHFGGVEFTCWEDDIKRRSGDSVARYSEILSEDVGFHKFLQYKFFSEWYKLKAFANKHGVKIIGDIPIYTAADSCDVWSRRELFDVNEDGTVKTVAGCPPDGFSADGQLWGNPVYRWEAHKKEGYDWWIKRLKFCFDMYDVVRIDHFRGFDEYYAIPAGNTTAKNGKWEKGPGIELFSAFERVCGKKEIIAEDLGFVTPSVRKLVSDCGFCGMKVLQFAFDSRDSGGSEYLPHNYPNNCAAYTGTHDNSTLLGWLSEISKVEKEMVRVYLCDWCTPDSELVLSLIGILMRSQAKYAIIPMQDWLGLDNCARINTPSTLGGNWIWRVGKDDLTEKLAIGIKEFAKRYGRI